MGWEQDLDEVRRVYEAQAEAPAVVSSQPFEATRIPLPLVAQERVPEDAGEIGFDGRGRPVAATSGVEEYAWEWRDDGSVLERATTVLGGRVSLIRRETVVSVDMLGRTRVQRLTWDGEVAVRADEVVRWEGGNSRGTDAARRAYFGPDGTVQQLRAMHAEAEGDVESGLERASRFFPTEVCWTPVGTGAWPGLDPARELVDSLAQALDRALRHAVAASPIEKPFLLHVVPHGTALPPVAWLAGAAWREHVRATDTTDGAAATGLWRGEDRGLTVKLDPAPFLDEDAQQACKTLSSGHRESWDVIAAVRERLAELLNADAIAPGLLAAVSSGAEDDALEQSYVGGADKDAFRRSLA